MTWDIQLKIGTVLITNDECQCTTLQCMKLIILKYNDNSDAIYINVLMSERLKTMEVPPLRQLDVNVGVALCLNGRQLAVPDTG